MDTDPSAPIVPLIPVATPDAGSTPQSLSIGSSEYTHSVENMALACALITLGVPYEEKRGGIIRVTGQGISDPYGRITWQFGDRSLINPLTTAEIIARWNDMAWIHGPGADTQLAAIRAFAWNFPKLLKRVHEDTPLVRHEHGGKTIFLSATADLATQDAFAKRVGI